VVAQSRPALVSVGERDATGGGTGWVWQRIGPRITASARIIRPGAGASVQQSRYDDQRESTRNSEPWPICPQRPRSYDPHCLAERQQSRQDTWNELKEQDAHPEMRAPLHKGP